MVVEVLYEATVKLNLLLVSISVTARMYFLMMPFWCSSERGCQEMEIEVDSTIPSEILEGEAVGAVQIQQINNDILIISLHNEHITHTIFWHSHRDAATEWAHFHCYCSKCECVLIMWMQLG